jgi:tetratricopeptide (TPR) repeat protein
VADREGHRERITHSARLAVAQLTVAAIVAWALPFVSGDRVNAAQARTRVGDYAGALRQLELAGRILPVLREDTYFVAQTGLLHHLLGRDDTPEGRLYRAVLLEKSGRDLEAADGYAALLRELPRSSACAREAARALLRCGLNDLNSGRVGLAIEELEAVRSYEPINLKANFTLQLAYLRTGRADELPDLVDQLRATYAWFQSPAKKPVLAFAHHNLFVAALQDGDASEALRQHRKSLRP